MTFVFVFCLDLKIKLNNLLMKNAEENEKYRKNSKKVQYITIHSDISIGGKSLYEKRGLEENKQIPELILYSKLSCLELDAHNLNTNLFTKDIFPNYIDFGRFELSKRDDPSNPSTKTKQDILNHFEKMFNDLNCEASLLVFSGFGGIIKEKGAKIGYFVLETPNGDEHLLYSEISGLWINRKTKEKNKDLLIITDANYSGLWVEECRKNNHYFPDISISVQASCGTDKLSNDLKGRGGILINNFVELNSGTEKPRFHVSVEHNPISVGFHYRIKNIFGLVTMFNSWKEMKTEYIEKTVDDEKYFGQLDQLNNDNRIGNGILHLNNGNRYEGEFIDNKMDGFGILYQKNGDIYHGQFYNNLKNGTGAYLYSNKKKYFGEFRNDLKEGQGTFYFISGDRLEGEFKSGKLGQSGLYFFKNGNIYDGHFKSEHFNGKGTFTFEDGKKYTGEFLNGNRSGNGSMIYKNGDKYEGEWKMDKFNGRGIYNHSNDDKYDGEWKDDNKTGKGLYIYQDGRKYDGEYKDDERDGKGVYICKNGDRYEGDWVKGKYNGNGIYYYNDGVVFDGIWKNDKKHGKGTYTYKDGKTFTGEWEEGKRK